jgi:hypothetical protein
MKIARVRGEEGDGMAHSAIAAPTNACVTLSTAKTVARPV